MPDWFGLVMIILLIPYLVYYTHLFIVFILLYSKSIYLYLKRLRIWIVSAITNFAPVKICLKSVQVKVMSLKILVGICVPTFSFYVVFSRSNNVQLFYLELCRLTWNSRYDLFFYSTICGTLNTCKIRANGFSVVRYDTGRGNVSLRSTAFV